MEHHASNTGATRHQPAINWLQPPVLLPLHSVASPGLTGSLLHLGSPFQVVPFCA
jgi:hypothetical protein